MLDSQQIGETAQKGPMYPSSSFPQRWHLTSHHSQQADTGPTCVQPSALLNTRVAWPNDRCNQDTAYSSPRRSLSVDKPTHPPPLAPDNL